MIITNDNEQKETELSQSLLLIGGAIFIIGQLCPLLVPLVASSELPLAWKTAFSGFLVLGMPELFVLISIAILGKSGFNYIKGKIFSCSCNFLDFRRSVTPNLD